MGQSLAQLEHSIFLMGDLADIPGMSADERTQLIAKYRAELDSLTTEVEALRTQFSQLAHGVPALRIAKALSTTTRRQRSAEIAFERIHQAVVKADETDRPPTAFENTEGNTFGHISLKTEENRTHGNSNRNRTKRGQRHS